MDQVEHQARGVAARKALGSKQKGIDYVEAETQSIVVKRRQKCEVFSSDGQCQRKTSSAESKQVMVLLRSQGK